MNDAEFPQERPAIKYIVGQVSKITDAQACSEGYYKSLGKLLQRLDKTDIQLNQIKKLTGDLTELIGQEGISERIQRGITNMNLTVANGLEDIEINSDARLREIQNKNAATLDDLYFKIRNDHQRLCDEILSNDAAIRRANLEVLSIMKDAAYSMRATVAPPWWKVWGVRVLFLAAGLLIGYLFSLVLPLLLAR